jgi:hypothetical protein
VCPVQTVTHVSGRSPANPRHINQLYLTPTASICGFFQVPIEHFRSRHVDPQNCVFDLDMSDAAVQRSFCPAGSLKEHQSNILLRKFFFSRAT